MKLFADNSTVEFGRGRIDSWCVFVTRPNIAKHAPRDTEYFARLVELRRIHPRIYDDYISVYEATNKAVSPAVLADISQRSLNYPPELRVEVEILLTILYAAMVAEENREHTRLGKRIKRLGIHQILIEAIPIGEAANFSKGMKWREIDALCQERGF